MCKPITRQGQVAGLTHNNYSGGANSNGANNGNNQTNNFSQVEMLLTRRNLTTVGHLIRATARMQVNADS